MKNMRMGCVGVLLVALALAVVSVASARQAPPPGSPTMVWITVVNPDSGTAVPGLDVQRWNNTAGSFTDQTTGTNGEVCFVCDGVSDYSFNCAVTIGGVKYAASSGKACQWDLTPGEWYIEHTIYLFKVP